MTTLLVTRAARIVALAAVCLVTMAAGRAAAQAPTPEAQDQAAPSPTPQVTAQVAQNPAPLATAQPRTIDLPAARHSGGAPLLDVLAQPTAPLDLGGGRLSMQHLANVLWASSGMGRARADAGPAAPSSSTARPTDVYVLLRAGAFLYDATDHRLKQVVEQDIRGLSGPQDPTWRAPVTLVYVINVDPASRLTTADRDISAAVSVGTIAQNVALYCASEGLTTTDRPLSNRRALGRRLRLRPNQRVVAAQAIGLRQK